MNTPDHLQGHLPADHCLSPRWQFRHLPLIGRMLADYPAQDLWQTDFARLPRARARRSPRARASTEQHTPSAAAE